MRQLVQSVPLGVYCRPSLAEFLDADAIFEVTRLGFDCPPSGRFDAHTTAVVRAFQRHWVQSRFDGVADGETRARLIGLLRLGA